MVSEGFFSLEAYFGHVSTLQPNYAQIRGDMLKWSRELASHVPASQAENSLKILDAVERFNAQTAGEVKRDVRELLWKVREPLGEGTPEIRKAYEKLRNLAFDNDYPRSHFTINPPPCSIPNFQIVAPHLLRGGQADQDGLNWLATHKADIELDLRGSDKDNAWDVPTHYPLQRINVAIEDFASPTFAQMEQVIQIIDDAQAEGKTVYMHCKAGIGRTGVATACWKISHGLSADEALAAERINSYAGTLKQEKFVREFESYWKTKQFATTVQGSPSQRETSL